MHKANDMHNAHYFDGASARLHPVGLVSDGGMLHIDGAGIEERIALDRVRMAEPFLHAPTVLYLPDGARVETADPATRAAMTTALAYRPSVVMRWQRHWYAALAALVLLLAVGAAVWLYVLPAAAEKIAANIPASMDASIGAAALTGLEKKLLLPSRMSDQRIAELRAILVEITPAAPRHPLRLLVRDAPLLGPNALALPDGTLIITDQMVRAMYQDSSMTPAESHDAAAGVLAHEIGHVQGRHSVRALARSSLTAAASAALLGDFSAVAAGVPAVLTNLHYSRAMETEADGYAIAVLKNKGWSLEPLALAFEWLDKVNEADPQHAMPGWMRQSLPYASSHPGTAERIARLRAAR